MKKGKVDFKNPVFISDFLKCQKKVCKEYIRYVKQLMSIDYKKSANFVYWLRDYLRYLKNEDKFNPAYNIKYRRGQVVYVNFGYRIGKELGGAHYAIVLDVHNADSGNNVTVVPMESYKGKDDKYAKIYFVGLGEAVVECLADKALAMSNSVAEQLEEGLKAQAFMQQDYRKRMIELKRLALQAQDVIDYTKKMAKESVADCGQIVTVSKQRIIHPCKKEDVLTGVLVPDELMGQITGRIKKLYLDT